MLWTTSDQITYHNQRHEARTDNVKAFGLKAMSCCAGAIRGHVVVKAGDVTFACAANLAELSPLRFGSASLETPHNNVNLFSLRHACGSAGAAIGWRWVAGIITIFSGVLWVVGTLLVPETYAPVLLKRRAEKLSHMTGQVYISKIEHDRGKQTLLQIYKVTLSRPWILLVREPIVLFLSIYTAIVYGTLYLTFAAFPIVYQEGRGWSQGVGGLAFIGVAVGMLLGILVTMIDNKRYNRAASERHAGTAPPEERLPSTMIGAIVLPIGLCIFAWTTYPRIHWIVSLIFTAALGFGNVMLFLGVSSYLIDTYTVYAASVLSANAVLRSIFDAVFPLFTPYMYRGLGVHWASSVPAFLALACVPLPFLFYRFGPAIRERCKYSAEAARVMAQLKRS